MPYIEQELREVLEKADPHFPGELNYVITQVILRYFRNRGAISYSAINEVIGVLECAKLELYRRVAAPYEDKKIIQNGDVY